MGTTTVRLVGNPFKIQKIYDRHHFGELVKHHVIEIRIMMYPLANKIIFKTGIHMHRTMP